MDSTSHTSASTVFQWLKDLWSETWARYAVLIGFTGNVITFFFPGLRSISLRIIAGSLLVVGFIWANFRVYKRLRAELNLARTALDERRPEKQWRDIMISMNIVGIPPSPQSIEITSSAKISVSRLDYLLSDEACIATDSCNLDGQSFNIPIQDNQVIKVWNTPRPDRNASDNSGPAKLRVTVSLGGSIYPLVLPVRMNVQFAGSTFFRQLIGSQDFHVSIGE